MKAALLALAVLVALSSTQAYAVKVDDMDAMIRDCYSEAARLCPDELASQSRVGITRCMVRKKSSISSICKGHFH